MFIKQLSVCDVPQLFREFGKCCVNQTGALSTLRCAAHTYMGSCRKKNDWQFSNPRIDTGWNILESYFLLYETWKSSTPEPVLIVLQYSLSALWFTKVWRMNFSRTLQHNILYCIIILLCTSNWRLSSCQAPCGLRSWRLVLHCPNTTAGISCVENSVYFFKLNVTYPMVEF